MKLSHISCYNIDGCKDIVTESDIFHVLVELCKSDERSMRIRRAEGELKTAQAMSGMLNK